MIITHGRVQHSRPLGSSSNGKTKDAGPMYCCHTPNSNTNPISDSDGLRLDIWISGCTYTLGT